MLAYRAGKSHRLPAGSRSAADSGSRKPNRYASIERVNLAPESRIGGGVGIGAKDAARILRTFKPTAIGANEAAMAIFDASAILAIADISHSRVPLSDDSRFRRLLSPILVF